MNEEVLFESKTDKSATKSEYQYLQLEEKTILEKNEEISEGEDKITFDDSFFRNPLVFDEFSATKVLLTFFSVSFTSFGVIDYTLGFSRLGLISLIVSLFIIFFRFSERNRQHTSLFVLIILTSLSMVTWKLVSKYIIDNSFENKIYPFLILQFSTTLFLSLWLLLIFLSGYSLQNNQYFYIQGNRFRASSGLYFLPVSAMNWYLIAMGFEFSIFVLFLLRESYIVAIIPFLSLLTSYFYVLSKSRQILQYTEVLLPLVMLTYVILRMLYSWVAPDDFTSLLGAMLIINMVVKQVVGLSILFTPSTNYYDMINDNGSYNMIVIFAYRSSEKNEKDDNQNQDATSSTPDKKEDKESVISDKSEMDKSYCNGIIVHQNTLNEANENLLKNSQDHVDIELSDQPSHSIIIDDNPEANIPYEDGNSRLVLNMN